MEKLAKTPKRPKTSETTESTENDLKRPKLKLKLKGITEIWRSIAFQFSFLSLSPSHFQCHKYLGLALAQLGLSLFSRIYIGRELGAGGTIARGEGQLGNLKPLTDFE